MRYPRWADEEPGEADFARDIGRVEAGGAGAGGCPPPALVLAAHDVEAPAELRDLVGPHVEHCPWCRAVADAAPEYYAPGLTWQEAARIRARVVSGSSAGSSSRLRPAGSATEASAWRRYGLPVALAASVGLAVWTGPFRLDLPRVAVPASRARPPEAAGPAVALRLEPLPAPAPPLVLTFRGGGPATTREAGYFTRGLAAYSRGAYAEAAALLEEAAHRESPPADAHLFLGVCRLLLDDAAAARVPLAAAATAAGSRGDDASWYLAVAADRTGDRAGAAAALSALCAGQSDRRDAACAALTQLPPQP